MQHVYRLFFPADEPDAEADLAMERKVWQQDLVSSTALASKNDLKLSAATKHVNICLTTIQHRVLSAIQTLYLLHDAEHDYSFDAAAILRGLYDVHLQGLYILQDPVNRAQDFVDFLWVQTKETVNFIEKSDSLLAETLRRNPLYSVGAPMVDSHYARVRAKFLTNKGDRCRSNWYRGTLADLARAVGYSTEYEFMQPKLSGSVHSTPYAMIHGAGLPKSGFLNFGWMFLFRVLGGIAEHLNVELDAYQRASVTHARHNLADYPGDTGAAVPS